MQARTTTIAFDGLTPQPITVECALTAGLPAFNIVGLPSKAVSEAKDRVRASFEEMAIALPSKRITVNLSPADIPKSGAHYDLPIAIALMAAFGLIPPDQAEKTVSLGELALSGALLPIKGALPAAITATTLDKTLLCPSSAGPEAAWGSTAPVFAAKNLHQVMEHLSGRTPLAPAKPGTTSQKQKNYDYSEVRGQEKAKRAFEIAAAGRHHLIMVGPPGAGKSMMAARLPSIMPPLSAQEALETAQIHSVTGLLSGGIARDRPFRAPHHSASMPALVGGGKIAGPGEISLAHNGVLFLDELPEFSRNALETLRQPLETGHVAVARANAHLEYPCRFLLIAAANPCRCGHLFDPAEACGRAPICGQDYMEKISGPLMDRFDLRLEIEAVPPEDLANASLGEPSATIAERVMDARARQTHRYKKFDHVTVNGDADGDVLKDTAKLSTPAQDLLLQATKRFKITARGYHRMIKVARTIADLAQSEQIDRPHIAQTVTYRLALSKVGKSQIK